MNTQTTFKTGLYVGSVTIYPPNSQPEPEVTSAREVMAAYEARMGYRIEWYEALYATSEIDY